MSDEIKDYEPDFRAAVGEFWGVRDNQARAQELSGLVDAGSRGSVTGGKHLDPIQDLIVRVIRDAGVPQGCISTGRSAGTRIPGFFRELKNWDVVVIDGNDDDAQVVMTIELKSQVGSFGNNQNNRIEEAVGQTYDFWKAADEVFPGGIRPWFGYVLIVEESPKSTTPVRTQPHIVPPDPAFSGASYIKRYALAFERLYKDRLLDATVVAQSVSKTTVVTYPTPTLSFQHFAVQVHNRVREYQSLTGAPWRPSD